MPIKKITLFILSVLLFSKINFSFGQETIRNNTLTLKKISDKISEADNANNKIKLRLNSIQSNQYSSSSLKNVPVNGNYLLKNFDERNPGNKKSIPLSEITTKLLENKLNKSKYFKDNYVPWESKRHFGLAAAEELLFNIAIPWTLARFGRTWDSTSGERWPFIGFQSIWSNLQNGWNYDGDNFTTNMFAHPFGGNLFFNSGRTNGYNFWESSAFALAGSYIWETFMETNQPAINDWVNTGMNGAAFGEILYRLSTMVTDNTASGSHRVWTEIAGGIFNPVRFFTRFVTGEYKRVFPNPEWRKPSKFDLSLDAGTRVLTNDSTSNKEIEGLFEMTIKYGDQYDLKNAKPFSHFHYNIAISTLSPNLTSMNAVGSLFTIPVSIKKAGKHALEMTLNYNYLNNTGFIYGNAAIVEQLKSKFKVKGLNVHTKLGIRLIPMGGTSDDYFLDSTDGRNYDFGQGLGAEGKIAIHKGGWELFDIEYTMDYIWTQSEPSYSKHFLQGGELKFQLPLKDYFVFGVGLGYYKRKSYYRYPTGFITNPATGQPMPTPDVSFQTPIIRVYFRTKIL
ncbi:MAG: DUF3943 domain-containing protein [bacterium]